MEWLTEKILRDVERRSDGYYLFLRDRTELAELFDDSGRDATAKDVAERVLGEDYYEDFYDSTNNVYEDVIEELDVENVIKLRNYIFINKLNNAYSFYSNWRKRDAQFSIGIT